MGKFLHNHFQLFRRMQSRRHEDDMELILAKEVEETRVLKVKGNDLAQELEHMKKELKKHKL